LNEELGELRVLHSSRVQTKSLAWVAAAGCWLGQLPSPGFLYTVVSIPI